MLKVSTFIVVLINFPDEPTFKSQAASKVILDSKENTSLSCKVESSPLSTITWWKDGQQIQNNSKILINENLQYRDKFKAIVISKLQLLLVNNSNTANYSCKATNKLATKYQETRIIVQCKCYFIILFDCFCCSLSLVFEVLVLFLTLPHGSNQWQFLSRCLPNGS